MPIRLSGLASGLDTEAIVGALVSSYSYKKDKYVKAQTKHAWKQDAWKELNTKVYSLYTSVGNMRYSSNYMLKKSTVSDATKAKVTASGNAVNGTQTLEIKKLATTGYLTGAKLKSGLTSDSAISSVGNVSFTEETTNEEGETVFTESKGVIDVAVNGKRTSIQVGSTTTIGQFINELNKAGVQANFDEKNQRIFVSATDTGAEKDFTITAGNQRGLKTLSVLGLLTDDYGTNKEEAAKFAKTKTVDGEEVYDSAATKEDLKSRLMRLHNAYVLKAQGKYIGTVEEPLTEQQIIHNEMYDTLMPYIMKDESSEEQAAKYDGELISYVESQMGKNFDWVQSDAESIIDAVFTQIDATLNESNEGVNLSEDAKGKKIAGSNSEIILNGETYTAETNSVTVNGLTVECLATTDGKVTINTTTDIDSLYDKVKDFLTNYNNLMNEMQKLYNADSAKDYEPLTDDEKAEMSDDQIEKWEQKIKDSLLRRDTTLSGVISTMTMAMFNTYEVNGVNYGWSTFGIHTLGTMNAEKNEGYAFHIDGDSEDTKTSGEKDKLRVALASDPETVIEFLKQVTTGLYKGLDEKMKSSAIKSVYTVYNDKQMASEYSSYSTLIKQWSDRVTEMEDSYYKKFSQMEAALAKLQSNSSSLTQMLGG